MTNADVINEMAEEIKVLKEQLDRETAEKVKYQNAFLAECRINRGLRADLDVSEESRIRSEQQLESETYEANRWCAKASELAEQVKYHKERASKIFKRMEKQDKRLDDCRQNNRELSEGLESRNKLIDELRLERRGVPFFQRVG